MSRHRTRGTQWTLHPLELTMLLARFGRDRLPYPVKFRATADTGSDYLAQRAAADQRIGEILDPGLETAAHLLISPSYRVEMMGELADGTILRSLTSVRADSAVVLTQDPGTTPDSGGAVRIRHTDVDDAIRYGLTVLPAVGPGRERPVMLSRSTTRSGVLSSVDTLSPAQHVERMFARPLTGAGAVTMAAGPAVDNRPDSDADGFFWIDVAGDGRYLVRSSAEAGRGMVDARPASVADIAAEIGRVIGAAGV